MLYYRHLNLYGNGKMYHRNGWLLINGWFNSSTTQNMERVQSQIFVNRPEKIAWYRRNAQSYLINLTYALSAQWIFLCTNGVTGNGKRIILGTFNWLARNCLMNSHLTGHGPTIRFSRYQIRHSIVTIIPSCPLIIHYLHQLIHCTYGVLNRTQKYTVTIWHHFIAWYWMQSNLNGKN